MKQRLVKQIARPIPKRRSGHRGPPQRRPRPTIQSQQEE